MKELRCNCCKKLLLKAKIKEGKVEVLCTRKGCKTMNTFESTISQEVFYPKDGVDIA